MFYCYNSVRLSAQLKCYCACFGQLAIYNNGDCFCLMQVFMVILIFEIHDYSSFFFIYDHENQGQFTVRKV